MPDQPPLLDDPSIRRLQQAFVHEEPATELPEVLRRAAGYLTVDPHAVTARPAADHGLTTTDLVAARQREPAAVTRVYTTYAPALFRFFMASLGNRQEAQDLTGDVFVSAIEGLPGFRGPVEALGGWLFRIARHDLYDLRRKQARSPGTTPLDNALEEAAVAAGAIEIPDQQPSTRTVLPAVQALPDREGVVPRAVLPHALHRPPNVGDRSTHAPLNRLSVREREILGLLANGWSNRRIAEECFLSLNTVRTHVQNVLVKLGVHSKLEAVALAMQHDWPPGAEEPEEPDDPEELALDRLEGGRVVAALGQLPPDQREVLLLRMAAGLTAPEVAAAVNKTTGAVKALQHRGLQSLARLLDLRGPARSDSAPGPPAPRRRRPAPHRADGMPGGEPGPPTRPQQG